jgi:hypothetical protein
MKLTDLSAARRIPLVGRHGFLQEASRCLRAGGVHVLYFEGEGGIGKTALLEAILERTRGGDQAGLARECTVADTIIDLYHVDVHAPEGLVRKITQVLGSQFFHETGEILDGLDRVCSADNVDVVLSQPTAVYRSFLEEFGGLAGGQVVLALDGLEALEFEPDPFQVGLGEKVPILSAGEWLIDTFLPALRGNVLILLAGRPHSLNRNGVGQRLHTLHGTSFSSQLQQLTVEALQQEETVEYLKTIAHLEEDRGDADAAMRLRDYAGERGDVIHFVTGGRPVLLALVADMVAHGWALPPSFGSTLEDLHQRDPEELRQEIERALVVRLQECPTAVGDAVRALAWLRKGATPELLARVMDLTCGDGGCDLETAELHLEQVACLTLAKVRSGDGRTFLHDELCTLFDRYVLRESSQEERDRIYRAVLRYYDEMATDPEQYVDRPFFFRPLNRARLRQAHVEQMHYQLCYRPNLGFAIYFWLAEEALQVRDEEMDLLLRTELLRTVRWLEETGSLGGLDLQEVELDTAIRWGMRALFLHNNPERALDILDRIQQWRGEDPQDLELAGVHIQLYQAAARIEQGAQGDWQRARSLLHAVQEKIDRILAGQHTGLPAPLSPATRPLWQARTPLAPHMASAAEGQLGRAKVLRTLVFKYRGHLDQKQGRYAEAVNHYQAAAVLQRGITLPARLTAGRHRQPKGVLALTLSSLSHAMAQIGRFEDARLVAMEAERWAYCSGSEYVLALALMARALVEGYDNRPKETLRFTEPALKMAERLRSPFVRGRIYLIRTRAHRYLLSPEENRRCKTQHLEEVTREASLAVNLLKDNPPDSIAALIERGCLFREIARRQHLQRREIEIVRPEQKSQQDLERAAALAGTVGLPDQQALAWTPLACLWYYTGRTEDADGALQHAYSCIPPGYFLPDPGAVKGLSQNAMLPIAQNGCRGDPCAPFWTVLSKAEMLKAYVALDQMQAAGDQVAQEEMLKETVKHMVLSLAYSEQIADKHFDMVRAEASLHQRILHDGPSIAQLYLSAQQVAEEWGLRQPTRFQRFLDRMFGPAHLWA